MDVLALIGLLVVVKWLIKFINGLRWLFS